MNRAASDNPLGLGLVMVGAAALAIATFLPLMQPAGAFRMVEDNTLIQHGGWWLIALALGIAASGYRASRGRPKEWWTPIMLCVVAAVLVIVNANDKDMRTLYPVQLNGTVDTSQPGMVASLGIAIYVAGAGVAIDLIGSLMLRQSTKERAADDALKAREEAETKKRPDRADQPRTQGKRQGARTDLEAEAEAAEAEALAAEARARAIRLRQEASQAKAKPAPSPQRSKPPQARQNPKPARSPQPDPQRAGGLKGFVQDWNSVPAWQEPAKPEGKAQHKGSPPKARKD